MTVAGDPLPLVGLVAFDLDGEELGEVARVYMGPEEAEWAALLLPSGCFVVVPLAEAEIYEDSLALAFPAALVRDSPLQQRVLLEDFTKSQEDELTAYFSGAPRPGIEVASAPMERGRQVASTAADGPQEAASAAKRPTERVASTTKAHGQQVLRSSAGQASEMVATAKEQAAGVAQRSEQSRSGDQRMRVASSALGDILRSVFGFPGAADKGFADQYLTEDAWDAADRVLTFVIVAAEAAGQPEPLELIGTTAQKLNPKAPTGRALEPMSNVELGVEETLAFLTAVMPVAAVLGAYLSGLPLEVFIDRFEEIDTAELVDASTQLTPESLLLLGLS